MTDTFVILKNWESILEQKFTIFSKSFLIPSLLVFMKFHLINRTKSFASHQYRSYLLATMVILAILSKSHCSKKGHKKSAVNVGLK